MTGTSDKSTKYMDFVGPSRRSATDPLIARPVSRKTVAAKPVATRKSANSRNVSETRARTATAERKAQSAIPKTTRVAVSRPVNEKPLVSREPKTTRNLYPTKESKSEGLKAASTTPTPQTKTEVSTKKSTSIDNTAVPDNNSYTLSGKSPFLKNYTIDKRPLSSSVPDKVTENFEKISFLGVSDAHGESTTRKKNIYEKKEIIDFEDDNNKSRESKKDKKDKKPVKIIDEEKGESGLVLFAVILVTVLLGAAVGAGAYFILPK